jgi:phosphatidylserine/phosphatidylglycerophosphate/cardiolipin synthase-like enzyme
VSEVALELLIQPDDGIDPILAAIDRARRTIDMTIFRLDRADVRRALAAAVRRGVTVRTLVAHTNRGGKGALRELEQRLLAAGVTVCRTAGDLVRYHGKPLIVDGSELYLLGFNYTRADVEASRSFGIVTRKRRLVREVLRLFEADAGRRPYVSKRGDLVVSPENSRPRLTAFIRGARRQLLIYDPRVSDPAILELLEERAASGVDVRILGRAAGRAAGIQVADYPGERLHVRAIIRDRRRAFLGSQSLRAEELDERREVGLLFRDRRVVRRMRAVFEDDWSRTELGRRGSEG